MRVLIVDDHEVVRRGIRSLLTAKSGIDVCGEAVNGLDAIEKAEQLRPDVITMDVSMPRMNGLEATREIKGRFPEISVLMVTQHDSPQMMKQAMSAGASGYVVKSAISTDLIAALEKLNAGNVGFESAIFGSAEPVLDTQEILARSKAFEKALQENERRLSDALDYNRAILANIAEGLYTLDENGLVTSMNPSAEKILGWTQAELQGKKMHEMTHYKHPDGSPFPAEECPGLQARQTGIPLREHEDTFIRKDGSFVPVIFTASPLRRDGRICGVIVNFRDDTERRRTKQELLTANRELKVSVDHLQLVTDRIPACVIRCSRDLRYLWVNERYGQWLKRPVDQIIGAKMSDVLGESAFKQLRPHFEAVLSGEVVSYEEEVLSYAGLGSRWIAATYSPTFDESGTRDGWISFVRDITERKRAEENLRQNEGRLSTEAEELSKLNTISSRLLRITNLKDGLSETLLAAIDLMEADKGNLQILNAEKGVLEIAVQHGFDREFLEYFREMPPETRSPSGRALRSRRSVVVKDIEAEPDFASVLPALRAAECKAVVSIPLCGSNGTPLGVLATHFRSAYRPSDEQLHRLELYAIAAGAFIERCRIEEELRKSEFRFRRLVESNIIPVVSLNMRGIREANDAFLKMVGYTREELEQGSVNWVRMTPPEYLPADMAGIERLKREGFFPAFEKEFVVKNGGRVPVLIGGVTVSSSPLEWLCFLVNLSELKRTEAALRDYQELLEKKVEERTEELSSLAGKLLSAQDEERRRLARELHDSVGQVLTVIGLNLSIIQKSAQHATGTSGIGPGISAIADESRGLIRQVSQEIRTTSYLLHPPLLDERGLEHALKMYVEGLHDRSDLRIEIDVAKDLGRLSPEQELALFRVIQESLTNIRRHSGSPSAIIRLWRKEESIFLDIEDEGSGMGADQLKKLQSESGGVGIAGMRERIRHLGGGLNIQSDGSGTRVLVRLPQTKSTKVMGFGAGTAAEA